MAAPILIQAIPSQTVNELAAFGPFDLKDFIQVSEGSAPAHFTAELKGGGALPKGMICTEDGIVTGIPAKETQGNYDVLITADNGEGSVEAEFILTVKPSLTKTGTDYLDQLKAEVWRAVEENLPIPDLAEMYDRPISPIEIYYLLERWGTLTIWDAFNLEPQGDKALLTLEGVSPHYNIYDRGSCLVASPKDLFSHERTLEDGLKTARAMAREVYKRDWTIQMVGFEKLSRAAWVEIQLLGDKHGKRLEVLGFSPTPDDVKVYSNESLNKSLE